MEENIKVYKKYNISPKLNICYNTILMQTEDDNNPAKKLLSNFKEIESIISVMIQIY